MVGASFSDVFASTGAARAAASASLSSEIRPRSAVSTAPSYNTSNWVTGVAADGIFVKDANMSSWTTGANGIPSGWTVIDDSD